MSVRRLSPGAGFLLCFVLLALALVTPPARFAAAEHVEPVEVPGDPSCADLGYAGAQFRIADPQPGTAAYPAPGGHTITLTITEDLLFANWASTTGIDAVIVKGGPNAHLYAYDPESFGDDWLIAPYISSEGTAQISHLTFCYDEEAAGLVVSKTASASYARTYDWTIAKTVAPAAWELFRGDSAVSDYTVTVSRAARDHSWAVSGTITVSNPGAAAVVIGGIADRLSDGTVAPVDCGVAFPHSLPAGATLACSYAVSLADGAARVNTATVTAPGGAELGSAAADVRFGAPSTVANPTVNVDDSNGMSWTFSDSGSVSYPRPLDCAGVTYSDGRGSVTLDNTATIRQTGQSASARVTVTCYELAVSKTAATSFARAWAWTVDKTGSVSNLTLETGASAPVDYTVRVDAAPRDSGFGVAGVITIANPHPTRAAQLTGVADLIDGTVAATVSCPALSVPAGGSLQCSYSAALPDAAQRLNRATATLRNTSFAATGAATPAGATGFSGTAPVVFGAPGSETDECVAVTDDRYGSLGAVCAAAAPKTFSYRLNVGPYATCGAYSYPNTASIRANDTGAAASDTWTVAVTVRCGDVGCTRTIGYWKNHREVLARYLPVTLGAPGGRDSVRVTTVDQAVAILNDGGSNGIKKLQAQLLATKLNLAAGADGAQVTAAIAEADAFLATHAASTWTGLSKAEQNQVLRWKDIFDNFNNGRIGPPHCN
ncbi:MAG TPA: hypothetical protein VGE07_15370 [Herpetosiphonaceae bacterium]